LEPTERYIVTIWNPRSECSYVFGPFREDELDSFDSMVWRNTDYDYDSILVSTMNRPNLFGTGMERG
jgi:hypothetical protein